MQDADFLRLKSWEPMLQWNLPFPFPLPLAEDGMQNVTLTCAPSSFGKEFQPAVLLPPQLEADSREELAFVQPPLSPMAADGPKLAMISNQLHPLPTIGGACSYYEESDLHWVVSSPDAPKRFLSRDMIACCADKSTNTEDLVQAPLTEGGQELKGDVYQQIDDIIDLLSGFSLQPSAAVDMEMEQSMEADASLLLLQPDMQRTPCTIVSRSDTSMNVNSVYSSKVQSTSLSGVFAPMEQALDRFAQQLTTSSRRLSHHSHVQEPSTSAPEPSPATECDTERLVISLSCSPSSTLDEGKDQDFDADLTLSRCSFLASSPPMPAGANSNADLSAVVAFSSQCMHSPIHKRSSSDASRSEGGSPLSLAGKHLLSPGLSFIAHDQSLNKENHFSNASMSMDDKLLGLHSSKLSKRPVSADQSRISTNTSSSSDRRSVLRDTSAEEEAVAAAEAELVMLETAEDVLISAGQQQSQCTSDSVVRFATSRSRTHHAEPLPSLQQTRPGTDRRDQMLLLLLILAVLLCLAMLVSDIRDALIAMLAAHSASGASTLHRPVNHSYSSKEVSMAVICDNRSTNMMALLLAPSKQLVLRSFSLVMALQGAVTQRLLHNAFLCAFGQVLVRVLKDSVKGVLRLITLMPRKHRDILLSW
jgi:hypothetical protein